MISRVDNRFKAWLATQIGTEMTKVFPNATSRPISSISSSSSSSSSSTDAKETVLTVWKKSMLLNCDGFTVFNSSGNLVYRVDNYIAGNKGEILLMNAAGDPLFTIRRKRLSLSDSWLVYEGETGENPLYSVRKKVNLRKSKRMAEVRSGKNCVVYEIEGSYGKRCCVVYDESRKIVAEIKRKEGVGIDVFRLVVQPEIDTALAMAFVILLDQMFGSS